MKYQILGLMFLTSSDSHVTPWLKIVPYTSWNNQKQSEGWTPYCPHKISSDKMYFPITLKSHHSLPAALKSHHSFLKANLSYPLKGFAPAITSFPSSDFPFVLCPFHQLKNSPVSPVVFLPSFFPIVVKDTLNFDIKFSLIFQNLSIDLKNY